MGDKLDTLLHFSAEAAKAESDVIAQLRGTAEKHMAAVGLILGFHLVEMKDLAFCDGGSKLVFSIVSLAGVAILLVALGVALWSMRVRTYPTYPRTTDLEGLRAENIGDEQAKSQLVDVYFALRDGIRDVNERRARLLRTSGALLILGFVASVIGQFGLKLL